MVLFLQIYRRTQCHRRQIILLPLVHFLLLLECLQPTYVLQPHQLMVPVLTFWSKPKLVQRLQLQHWRTQRQSHHLWQQLLLLMWLFLHQVSRTLLVHIEKFADVLIHKFHKGSLRSHLAKDMKKMLF